MLRWRLSRPAVSALAAMLLALASVGPVRAQDCSTAVRQGDLNRCAHEDFLAANEAMARTFRTVAAPLPRVSRETLRRAQDAWLDWRTAACEFEASASRGGSAAAMVRARCAARMSQERTAALLRIADCPEGDLACPRPAAR